MDVTDARKGVIELDLETLQAVAQEQFPFSISALSESKHPIPLTIATNLSLHLHDPRVSLRRTPPGLDDQVDREAARLQDYRRLFSKEPCPVYASLYKPGPLSICKSIDHSCFRFVINGRQYMSRPRETTGIAMVISTSLVAFLV